MLPGKCFKITLMYVLDQVNMSGPIRYTNAAGNCILMKKHEMRLKF